MMTSPLVSSIIVPEPPVGELSKGVSVPVNNVRLSIIISSESARRFRPARCLSPCFVRPGTWPLPRENRRLMRVSFVEVG